MPKTYTVPPPPHHNEGKTVAGWTLNIGIVIGSVIVAAGLVLGGMAVLLWAGGIVILASIVAGITLSLAGMGQPRGRSAGPDEKAGHRAAVAQPPAVQPAEADAR